MGLAVTCRENHLATEVVGARYARFMRMSAVSLVGPTRLDGMRLCSMEATHSSIVAESQTWALCPTSS